MHTCIPLVLFRFVSSFCVTCNTITPFWIESIDKGEETDANSAAKDKIISLSKKTSFVHKKLAIMVLASDSDTKPK